MSFLEIFQPDLRHLREERERQQLVVPRPPAAGPGSLGIDLDGGTALIPAAADTDPEPGAVSAPEPAAEPQPG